MGRRKEEGKGSPFGTCLPHAAHPSRRPNLRGLTGLCRTTTSQEKEVLLELLVPLLAVIHHLEFKSSESDRSGQAPNCDSWRQLRSVSARRGFKAGLISQHCGKLSTLMGRKHMQAR